MSTKPFDFLQSASDMLSENGLGDPGLLHTELMKFLKMLDAMVAMARAQELHRSLGVGAKLLYEVAQGGLSNPEIVALAVVLWQKDNPGEKAYGK